MAKFNKNYKDKGNSHKQIQKPGNKNLGSKNAKGIVKAKNKVKNVPGNVYAKKHVPGKGNTHAKLNLVGDVGGTKFNKHVKADQQNRKVPAKPNSPKGIGNAKGKNQKKPYQQIENALKVAKPQHDAKPQHVAKPQHAANTKQKKPVIVKGPTKASKGPKPLIKLEKPEQNSPEKKKTKKKNNDLKSLLPPAEIKQSSPSKKKAVKKNKKIKPPKANLENAPPFNEADFMEVITHEKIENVVMALQKMISESSKKLKSQIFKDYKYVLNVTSFKVANCPNRTVKMNLKHSLLSADDDVCFIVSDLKRGSHHDFEATKEKYEDNLKANGITNIKTVIPFKQLKKEYGSYEMKTKLANTYDAVMCDGRIIGHVVGFLGKKFQKSPHVPFPVRMNTENLAQQVKTSLRRTAYRQGERAIMSSIVVGTSKMTSDQLVDNVETVLAQLKELHPGSYENIRSLYLRINVVSTASLPIYISLCQPPANVPHVVGTKELKLKQIKANAKKILSKFHVANDGTLVAVGTNGKSIAGKKRPAEQATLEDSTKSKKIKKAVKEDSGKIAPVKKNKEVRVNGKDAKPVKPKQIKTESDDDDDDGTDEEAVAKAPKNKKISKLAILQTTEEQDTDESDDDFLGDDKDSDEDDESDDDNDEEGDDDDDEEGDDDDDGESDDDDDEESDDDDSD